MLVDLDEEDDTLRCYVDLGDFNSHDRTEVCEQLSGDEFAETLRYYVDETQDARQMVRGSASKSIGTLLISELA